MNRVEEVFAVAAGTAGGFAAYHLAGSHGWALAAAVAAAALVCAAAGYGIGHFLSWGFFTHRQMPANRVRYQRFRLKLRLHPGPGMATLYELWLRWGRLACWRPGKRSRPGLTWYERAGHAWQHSLKLGRAQWLHTVRLPLHTHVVLYAGPQTGKSGLLASMVMDFPGPVVSTTTKADVHALTAGIRARFRGPVHVFNPQGIGGVPSTFRWNPIAGCEVEETAQRRADAFAGAVSQKGVEDGSFWAQKASSYMRAYFHAAALAGGDMAMVDGWVRGLGVDEPEKILSRAGKPGWAAELAELRSKAEKTAATVRMTMTRALAFMIDPKLAECVLPGPGEGLNLEAFLTSAQTLYMIADSDTDDAPIAPLFACMASEIHHTAEIIGQASKAKRLDPPLLMALDEIVQVCPVPVPKWAADSGSKGILLVIVAHGEAQLRTRWGKDGAQVIWDTCTTRLLLPGVADTDTLHKASVLAGDIRLHSGQAEERFDYHRIVTEDMIRDLTGTRALVISRNLAPVIIKLTQAWHTPAYRKARRGGYAAVAVTAAAPAPAKIPAAAWPLPPVTPGNGNGNGNGHGGDGAAAPVTLPDIEAAGESGMDEGGSLPWGPS